jgi:hypothetical protein
MGWVGRGLARPWAGLDMNWPRHGLGRKWAGLAICLSSPWAGLLVGSAGLAPVHL